MSSVILLPIMSNACIVVRMGRNFYSVCHQCKVSLMHLRGKEGDNMQFFAKVHSDHEKHTEIYNDYVSEPPDDYKDVFDSYNPNFEKELDNAKNSHR